VAQSGRARREERRASHKWKAFSVIILILRGKRGRGEEGRLAIVAGSGRRRGEKKRKKKCAWAGKERGNGAIFTYLRLARKKKRGGGEDALGGYS